MLRSAACAVPQDRVRVSIHQLRDRLADGGDSPNTTTVHGEWACCWGLRDAGHTPYGAQYGCLVVMPGMHVGRLEVVNQLAYLETPGGF